MVSILRWQLIPRFRSGKVEDIGKVEDTTIDPAHLIDRRADVASMLSNPVRRQIRDLLRRSSDSLTLTEIARSIGQSEPNTYRHLCKMLEAGIVTKRVAKVDGRLVTLYSLSDYYNKLFSDVESKPDILPDILPVCVLFAVYSALSILTVILPSHLLTLYSHFGVKSIDSIIMINLTGFITTAVILAYYAIYAMVKGGRGSRSGNDSSSSSIGNGNSGCNIKNQIGDKND